MEILTKKDLSKSLKEETSHDENATFSERENRSTVSLYRLIMSYGSKHPRERYIRFVKDVTEQESCIIIGRCANIIYKDDPDCVSVYLHADPDIRKKRIQERDHVSEKEAAETLREVDEKRSAFQEQCTATRWGDGNEYDLCIDTGKIGIEKAAELILQYIKIQEMKKREAFTRQGFPQIKKCRRWDLNPHDIATTGT